MRHWRWYSKVLLGLVLAAFAYWVWPTPWRYDHLGYEGGHRVPVRTHRVTGHEQVLWHRGWSDLPAKP